MSENMSYNAFSKIFKKWGGWTTLILFLLCVGINIYFRLFPAYFPQIKRRAKDDVKAEAWQEAKERVDDLYPDYSPDAKNKLIEQLLKEDKKGWPEKIEKKYQELKDMYQDEKGLTYLMEYDSYKWLHYTKNILRFGDLGDKRINGESYDTYTLSPTGARIGHVRFPFYLAAYLYRIVRSFFRGISLTAFAFYLPLFYIFIFLALLYAFTRFIFSSDLAAFFSVLFIGMNGQLLQKSAAGWYDYDILSWIFPLVIAWLLIIAMRRKGDIKRVVIYSLLASFFVGLYAYAWIGWWFIFIVLFSSQIFLLIIAYPVNYKRPAIANKEAAVYLISSLIFVTGGMLFCAIIPRINLAKEVILQAKDALNIGGSLSSDIWPNVFYTVSELKSLSLREMINALYGPIPFFCSVLGMSWICTKGLYLSVKGGKGADKKEFLVIMFFWAIFMGYASLHGARFVIFLSIPLGIFLGGLIKDIGDLIKKAISFDLRWGIVACIIFVICISWLGGRFIVTGKRWAMDLYPLMYDHLNDAMAYVRGNTPQDAIINSWWDRGAIFAEIGERRVLFDGQSQNTPVAYWVARALLSNDEYKAVRILRMLNNASYRTYDTLNSHINDPFKCITVLEGLLNVGRGDAADLLRREGVPSDSIDEALHGLYNTPPPAYFLVEHSIIGMMTPISFLGTWDFKKLFIKRNIDRPRREVEKGLKEIFGLSEEESGEYYEKTSLAVRVVEPEKVLAKERRFYTTRSIGAKRGNIVHFDNKVIFDLTTKEARHYPSMESQGIPIPNAYLFQDDRFENLTRKDLKMMDMAILIMAEGEDYSSILVDKGIADSLFTRLFLLKGKGLEYFEPFYINEETRIYIFKIRWDLLNE